MDGVRVRVLGAQGEEIGQDLLEAMQRPMPLEAVNAEWQKAGRGVTLEVLINTQGSEEVTERLWAEVGKELSWRLLAHGGSFGLYLDTSDLPFDTVLGWVRGATSGRPSAVADLALTSHPHTAGFEWNTESVRCFLVQSTRAPKLGAWIWSLWSETSPGNFFFPDFALVVYEGNMSKRLNRDEPLGETEFVGSLSKATAWLVPHGDPPLFLVGLPAGSELYSDLVATGARGQVRP